MGIRTGKALQELIEASKFYKKKAKESKKDKKLFSEYMVAVFILEVAQALQLEAFANPEKEHVKVRLLEEAMEYYRRSFDSLHWSDSNVKLAFMERLRD